MLDFQVQLALGDQELSDSEWRQLLAAEEGLVLLRGQWVEVDRDKLTEALDHWQYFQRQSQRGCRLSKACGFWPAPPRTWPPTQPAATGGASGRSSTRATGWANCWRSCGIPERLQRPGPATDLQATLRRIKPPASTGSGSCPSLGLGACLADDMGLGKTIQVLALLTALKKRRATSRRSGAAGLAAWRTGRPRWPASRPPCAAASSILRKRPRTSWTGWPAIPAGLCKTRTWCRPPTACCCGSRGCRRSAWRLVMLDEAQAIKNPAARQTKAVKQLKADARIALTGTPVENRLSDLWSLFDFLCPGLLGSQEQFKNFVKTPDDRQEQPLRPAARLVQPYILRRLKTDKRSSPTCRTRPKSGPSAA